VHHPTAELIRDIPDFPKPGIVFKDITPVLADAAALQSVVEDLAAPYVGSGVTHVVGIEARGFILATPVARRLSAGFIPIRKPGKLPYTTNSVSYDLEYGTDQLEIHIDALGPGDRVVLVDDVIATGGTARAAIELLAGLDVEVMAMAVYVELSFLEGRLLLDGLPLHALVAYG